MGIDSKLDKIIGLLYDEGELLFKQVPTTDIIVFGKKKFNLDWNDTDILFIMNVLQGEGYVIMNKGDFTGSRLTMPTYSLTSKGVRLKQNGGFVRKKRIEFLTQFLIFSASIVTIIVGFTTCFDFYKKYLNPTEVSTENAKQTSTKCYNYCPDSCGIKHKKSVVDSSTIRQNIKKPNIVPTKK